MNTNEHIKTCDEAAANTAVKIETKAFNDHTKTVITLRSIVNVVKTPITRD